MSCHPFGAYIIYYLYRGLHPPLYPVGLSGLTLKSLYVNVSQTEGCLPV